MQEPAQKSLHNLIVNFRTVRDRTEFLEHLDKLSQTAFNIKADRQREMFDILPKSIADLLSTYFSESKIDVQNTQQFTDALIALRETLMKIPVIRIHIASELSLPLVQEISDWVRQQLGDTVLLDIVIDKRLIAGAVIEWGGYYKDYSFLKKYHALKDQGKLAEILRLS